MVTWSGRSVARSSHSGFFFAHSSVGGMIGAVCTSPLDVVKTRLQSTFYQQRLPAPPVSTTALTQTRHLWSHFVETSRLLVSIKEVEGVAGYFKGLGPNLVGVVPARSINFYIYGNGKRWYTELNHGRETAGVHLISAATAGVVTSTVTNPIWVVKTRLQLQGNQRLYKNSVDCIAHIVKEEGIRGLYKGMSASYLGVIEGTVQWVIYEQLKQRWGVHTHKDDTKSAKQWAGNLGAAAISKLVAACVAYPHEVVRTRLRQPAEANGVVKYTGLLQTFRLVWKEEGLASLYGGMSAHLMRVVPNAAIMFFCYEAIVHHFG
ncbi:mitochondrial carrier domain-containing protein [Gongronella butleri]|nr:mitochondrial carrier domain-containing protein [Gongronella butleri]